MNCLDLEKITLLSFFNTICTSLVVSQMELKLTPFTGLVFKLTGGLKYGVKTWLRTKKVAFFQDREVDIQPLLGIQKWLFLVASMKPSNV